eukprot:scaffold239645_cov17-Tisochrysis_lutea.AAC.1
MACTEIPKRSSPMPCALLEQVSQAKHASIPICCMLKLYGEWLNEGVSAARQGLTLSSGVTHGTGYDGSGRGVFFAMNVHAKASASSFTIQGLCPCNVQIGSPFLVDGACMKRQVRWVLRRVIRMISQKNLSKGIALLCRLERQHVP